jgi:hypothetical protein
MVADKQTETKAPPVEAGKPGADKAAGQTLHGQVQEIHANGNVTPSAADVAKGNAVADQHYGKVAIVGHGAAGDHATTGKPDANAPKPEASKTEPPKADTGMWGWMKSEASGVVNGAEHFGAAVVQKGSDVVKSATNEYHDAKNYVGNKVDQIENKAHQVEHAVSAAVHSDTMHNLEDVGKTLAEGVGDSAKKAWHGVEHGVEAAGKGIHDGAVWAEHNPGKAIAIGVGAVAVVGAVAAVEVLSGGLATPAIAAASAWLTTGTAAAVFEGLGVAAAGTATAGAAWDVAKHGEIGVLMNQQHESPEKVAEAHKMLKKDTGDALLGDLTLAGGQALKWGVKGIAALRAGSAIEGTVAATETAPAIEAAGAVRVASQAPEAAAAAPGAVAPIADAADNPLLTHAENVVERLAEEVVDAGAVTASATSLATMLDKCRQIAGVAGTAYQHANDAGSAFSTVKNTLGLVTRGYAVAAPDKHTVSPQAGKDGIPDEPTKH